MKQQNTEPTNMFFNKHFLIFSSLLILLIATNPLHLHKWKKSSPNFSVLHSFSTLFRSVDTISTQDYYVFAVRNKRSASSTLDLGIVSHWFPISKTGALGRVLKSRSRGGKEDVFLTVATVNVVVLLLWWYMSRTEHGTTFMAKHWTASRYNLQHGRVYTLFTSCISHADFIHLLFNLFLFYQITQVVLPNIMSRWECFMFLIAAGTFASSISVLVNNFILHQRSQLVGFSGCCYSLLAVVAIAQPAAEWNMMGMQLSTVEFLIASLVVDFIARRGRGVDVVCHFGGIVYGYVWMNACDEGFADALCQPMRWLELYPPNNWRTVDMRKWSLMWVSVWLGCGVTSLCMWRRSSL